MLTNTSFTSHLFTQHDFSVSEGSPYPMGASLNAHGCNFVIHAGEAKHVELCLFDLVENEVARIILPCKKGSLHFGYVPHIVAGQRYAFRVFGDFKPELGLRYDPRKLLLDPYAKALTRPIIWNDSEYADDSADMLPKCIITSDSFDWQGIVKPQVHRRDTVLYECHVCGFSQRNPAVAANKRGKYLGLSDPSSIAHLKNLGITSVQLLPVASFMSEPRLKTLGLSNYWGYNPVLFMVPDPRYADADAVTEFKTMVRELHRHGIEVILDVVFNHTAEAGADGPNLCYRGLDNKHYYLFDRIAETPDYQHYANNTGCGNSVAMDHPIALKLILDSLRYWYQEMQVDGFRFDLAVSMGREHNRYRRDAAFFKAIEQDPVLSAAKLIAEPWDIGPDGYQLGHFPEQWMECNDRYRDSLRAFWRGDKGLLGEIATRLMGSRDTFYAHQRSIHSSVNYICYHDGFTLQDIVSYEQRHNAANGEDNRDGHGHNLSANYGHEGETDDSCVNSIREKQKRNLVASLLLSQGVPHFLGGDEVSRTQQGNNNAYCQNNHLSWFDWNLSHSQQQFFEFTRYVLALRKRSGLFRHLHLESDSYERSHLFYDHVRWYRSDGEHMHQHDWHDAERSSIALELRRYDQQCERWYWMLNAEDKQHRFTLPPLKTGQAWCLVLDTAFIDQRSLPRFSQQCSFVMSPQSLALLEVVNINVDE